jgi:hypothetical protein
VTGYEPSKRAMEHAHNSSSSRRKPTASQKRPPQSHKLQRSQHAIGD